ncbi:MAG: NAD(P)/FAD-dependent oxidoreductase [Candidatus Marinimicrobia bacterium]|nr:NAD(P)/FAD-dependent oxidoreductase [Candidatus Neomarinimicrobiota bacterium]
MTLDYKNIDLAVIGGGAAGLMAAGRAAEKGLKVLLIDKKKKVGSKILITGKGRCNITNAENDLKTFLKVYGSAENWTRKAFYHFNNQAAIDFFESHSLPLKTERGQRVFPVSDSAVDIVRVLKSYAIDHGVTLLLENPVTNIVHSPEDGIKYLKLSNGKQITAKHYLICTGGKSYPATGSSGEAYGWLAEMGHDIIPPRPALCPIIVKNGFVKQLEGLSLKNVRLSFWKGAKIDERFGEALFTSNGMSGPACLDLSIVISKNDIKNTQLSIDFKPALDRKKLDKRLLRDFQDQPQKHFKNTLKALLPSKLIPVMIELSGISDEKKVSEISKIERKKLLTLLKDFRMDIKELAGFEKAIVTAGGVSLKDVDSKNMQSRKVKNLSLAGEVLNADARTGGFNLQFAWSTARLAADKIADSLLH